MSENTLTGPFALPSMIPSTMRAVVVGRDTAPGSPTRLSEVSTPVPGPGQVLVAVHATTVISSEIATSAGVSTAHLPLVLGNDFVGTIVSAPGAEHRIGERVLGGYGGYGYTRDGAWADYVCVEAAEAFPVDASLDDLTIATVPGSFTAATGALEALGDVHGRTLLIRGGTSGVGLAVATLAADRGATVLATTRSEDKRQRLLEHGADVALLDTDDLPATVRAVVPEGVDLAVELLGVSGLPRTLACVRPQGVVCLTGLLDDQTTSIRTGVREDRAELVYPHPMELIPPGVRLTSGGVVNTPRTAALVRGWIEGLAQGRYRMPLDSVFELEEIAAAQRRRADPAAFGKVVLRIAG